MNPEESQNQELQSEGLEQTDIQPLETASLDHQTPDQDLIPESTIEESTGDLKPALIQESSIMNDLSSNYILPQTASELEQLQQKKMELQAEVNNLEIIYKNLQSQINETQTALNKIIQESLSQLEQRKQTLQIAVEQLERRQERIRNEMKTTFAGTSQDLAIRVQGFKDYLTGSLQDLAASAEQLQLVQITKEKEKERPVIKEFKPVKTETETLQFAQQQFQETSKKIRRLMDQYRNEPDYYGPAWQLRRTFEPIHAEKVSNWFFTLGGRGAIRTMGSRLQNVLIASAATSILYKLYGDRIRALILANTPERLGEWRRGLQDCLGIGRAEFGPDKGVILFEAPTALAQKADRLVKANQLPLIIIDDSEEQVSLGLLQFPLWLAFAPDPKMMKDFDDEF